MTVLDEQLDQIEIPACVEIERIQEVGKINPRDYLLKETLNFRNCFFIDVSRSLRYNDQTS